MFELKEFKTVRDLDEADRLLHQDRKNVILGGLLWMRLGSRRYHTGIDLSRAGLDRITDRGDFIEIGAMTCLRQVETSPVLEQTAGTLFRDALSGIVGVQFRNLATVGGSVFSRFGFSDLITALLVLDTRVRLFRKGELPLAEFLETGAGRDILVSLTIAKEPVRTCYQSLRLTATDFPVLCTAISHGSDGWRIALGARPARARLATGTAALLADRPGPEQIEAAGKVLVDELSLGSDQRGSQAFRQRIAPVLLNRGITELCR